MSEAEELDRVAPVFAALAARFDVVLSMDTSSPAVMTACAALGAGLINDVRALSRPGALEAAAASTLPICLMHIRGEPRTMQQSPLYQDVVAEVIGYLHERVTNAVAAGIGRERLLVDPGFGFGKTVAHNLELMNGLALFHSLGCPLVIGPSRKRTIGALSGEAPVDKRLGGSIAFALKGAEQGAQIVRVHDVFETVQALRVWRGMRDQALTPRV